VVFLIVIVVCALSGCKKKDGVVQGGGSQNTSGETQLQNAVPRGTETVVRAEYLIDVIRNYCGRSDSRPIAPIGWSKDGRFAMLKSEDTGERGGWAYSLVMMNTANDEKTVIWGLTDMDQASNQDESDSLKVFLKDLEKNPNVNKSIAILSKYRILEYEKQSEAAMESPGKKVRCNDTVITVNAISDVKTVNESANFETQGIEYSIVIEAEKKGKKTITSGKQEGHGIQVNGFFVSPYEPRIIVMYDVERRSYGGISYNTFFAGGDLISRFK
jgi:hypothetical protein